MWTRCPAGTSFGADSPLLGTGSGGTGEGRGAPCSMGARTPAPLSDNPPSPCAETFAVWPGATRAYSPVLKSLTSTDPPNTCTLELLLFTVTLNCVPLTAATRNGVSTSKLLTFRFSTVSSIEPDCWMIVVEVASFWVAGIVSAELGASRTVSLPRSSRTRPLLPVRIESPGLSCAWSVNETGWTPAFITQTFPLDLLTCHAVASMFGVWAAAPAHKAARVGRQNRIVSRWNRNNMARFPCVRVG